ncbi:Avr9/Cf-9 rapidly elicited protein [Melia azedarach]|uniref:Avr9/Cf-9 rapidly elicited protein n=1 Tax=Melia azedarach TaxID=155640 RepID=A0ACC1XAW2_MELAZ|nr:Avr9/Cf-9 rapidly elicited protein [Melia azedarach]
MEIEPRPPVVAKKLWNIVRVVFYMMKAGISKSKLMVDFHLMLKRGNKLAGKAIGNLLFHHHSSFSCRSNDAHLSFVSPKEYEFSCSNSPAFYPFYALKRKHHHHHHLPKSSYKYDDVTTVQAVQKVLEMLNNNDQAVEASPLTTLPGFGRSPMVRQLRITDSPFPLKDEGDSQVDKAAEEFIKKFYKDLKSQQKTMAALESPYHDSWGR